MSSYKKPDAPFESKGFWPSVEAALEGIVHTLQSERNMRIHFMMGFLVLIAGVYFNLSSVEFMMLCFAVTFVLVAEMFNTAVERIVDYISKEYHPLAKIAKDVGAGAVFVASVNACIVGYLLLITRLHRYVEGAFGLIKQSTWNISLIILFAVIGIVLLVKVLRGERDLLTGGMPSGHAALAFAIWMIVTLVTGESLVSLLVFFVAVLVAKSRLARGVHTMAQVVIGGLLGALIALVAFKVLS